MKGPNKNILNIKYHFISLLVKQRLVKIYIALKILNLVT